MRGHRLAALAGACLLCLLAVNARADGPGRRALLVGISEYDRGQPGSLWRDLHGDRDVSAVREVLISRFGFEEDCIRLLITSAETTHRSIVHAFRSFLIDQTQPGDIVYFHYAGHGHRAFDDSGDEVDGWDETLVPSDWRTGRDSNEITDDEISELLAELKQREPASVTLVFDCCHAGSVTRGPNTTFRGLGPDAPLPARGSVGRGAPEGAGGMLARGEADGLGYVAVFAARHDQQARETPDDSGEPMGLLTYAWIRTLLAAEPQTTYRDLFERLTELVAQRNPSQAPQLEGDRDTVLFEGTALPPTRYIPVAVEHRDDGDALVLQAGELHGMTTGSRFALYAAGTRDFEHTEPLAEALLTWLELTRSGLELLEEHRGRVSLDELAAARAVEREHAYGDNRLRVDLSALAAEPRGRELADALREVPLVADATGADDWQVRVRPRDEAGVFPLVAEREDGTVLCAVRPDGERVREFSDGERLVADIWNALERESRWRFLAALENPGPASRAQVALRVVPVHVDVAESGAIRGVTGDRDLPVSEGGEVQLAPGDYVRFEIENLGDDEVWVTVLDLRPDGLVGPVYPYPDVSVGENKVPPGSTVQLPWRDYLFRIDPSVGLEMFRVIATAEPSDFSVFIDPETVRGESAPQPRTPLEQLLRAATAGTRSQRVPVAVSDWATDTVVIRVTDAADE